MLLGEKVDGKAEEPPKGWPVKGHACLVKLEFYPVVMENFNQGNRPNESFWWGRGSISFETGSNSPGERVWVVGHPYRKFLQWEQQVGWQSEKS